MVFAWRLILLMLPGLAPLPAAGLHFGKQGRGEGEGKALRRTSLHVESALDTPESPGARAASRQVLLIVAGLARHIEETWPGLEQALVVPNEEAGYTFTTFFSTDAGLGCHRDSPKWNSRKCEEPTDPKSNVEQIEKLFAPRAVTVLDYQGLDRVGPGGSASRFSDGVDDDGDADACVRAHDGSGGTTDACNGWSWWNRVHNVLTSLEPGARFDRMVAIRPDVVLQWAPKAGAPPRDGPVVLRLDEMCEKKPGISFVTASWRQSRPFWLHDRDFDFMQILCPGEKLPVYEQAIKAPTRICKAKEPLPSLPPGFHSPRAWNKDAWYCRLVQLFQNNNISVSNWDDDYHLSWLKRFAGPGAAHRQGTD